MVVVRDPAPEVPERVAPVQEPVGIAGAVVAGIIAAVTFIGFLLIPTFLPAIIAIAVVFVIGVILFALIGRHRLVLSPEEEYAISRRQARRPAEGGLRRHGGEVFGKDEPKK